MNTNIKDKAVSPLQHQLEGEVAWDDVEKRITEAIRRFSRNAEIKGFRKGKAPAGVVRAKLGEKERPTSAPRPCRRSCV